MLTSVISSKEKLAYSVEEISKLTSLSKAFLWLEIRRGKLKAKNFGVRRVVLTEDLEAYLRNEDKKD